MRYLWKKATEEYSPGACKPWGLINTSTLQSFKNTFLSRNLSKILVCLKMFYFLEKAGKNRRSVGGSAPNPPLASGGWGAAPRPPNCVTFTNL